MFLNKDIVAIEKHDGICSLIYFVADEFPESFLHSLVFSIMHSRST